MGKKLVWVETDDSGKPVTPSHLYRWDMPAGEYASLCLASLPSALLIGAEEREELAKTIYDCDALGHGWKWDDAGDYARRKREKYLAVCDAILAAGWRKVAAVDREKLLREIRDALTEAVMTNTENDPYNADAEARALLARVEGESHV